MSNGDQFIIIVLAVESEGMQQFENNQPDSRRRKENNERNGPQ